MQTIGERVALRRKAAGITQKELAQLAKVAQPTVTALEKGKSRSSAHLVPIAIALHTDPLWLYTGKGSPDLDPNRYPASDIRDAVISAFGVLQRVDKPVSAERFADVVLALCVENAAGTDLASQLAYAKGALSHADE